MKKRLLAFLVLICLIMDTVPVAYAEGTAENPYAGKIISVMGDSISTFAGHAESEKNRYPDSTDAKNDVSDINETWWMQLVTELGTTLGVSESRGGSTVSNNIDADVSSDGRIGKTVAMASWDRINDLDNNGTPDVILFYGGTNDRTRVGDGRYTLGTFDAATAPTEINQDAYKWDTVVDAYSEALLRMKYTYPKAEIISILTIANGKAAWETFNAEIKKVCDHYGVKTISLDVVTSVGLLDDKHPNMYGMDIVTNAVKAAMLDEPFQYPTYPHAMVREVPADAYSDTNLWPTDPETGYYKGYLWNGTYPSVTLSVKEGDQVYASSFAKSGGIVVAYIADGKVIKYLSKEEVYVAYRDKGYLTVPAGVDAINIPMWTDDENSVVNLKNLPARPTDEPDDVPSDEPTEVPESFKHLKQIPEGATCEDNLWTLLGSDAEYWKGTAWNTTYSSITFPVKAGDKIDAYSFKSKGENGSSNRYGIVLTFFDEDGKVIWAPGPTSDPNATSGTYYEYVKNGGYLIAPEGAVAVNIPMWKANENAYVKLLTLPAKPGTETSGDGNGDGKIDEADYDILARYLAGWDGYAEQIVSMGAADVNKDGKVSTADVTVLARYLAGWEGYAKYFE